MAAKTATGPEDDSLSAGRRIGARALEHIRHLAVDIGPRGATTEGERLGSEYAESQMREWGSDIRVEPFGCYWTLTLPWGLVGLLMVATAVLLWVSPLTAAITAGLNFLVYLPLASGRGDIGALFPKRPSRNVWTRVLPRDAGGEGDRSEPAGPSRPRRRVVFMAHVDTTRASLLYEPSQLRRLRFNHMVNLASVLGLLILALAALGSTGTAAAALPGQGVALTRSLLLGTRVAGSLLGAVALYGLGVLAHRELAMPYVSGANDNASGVGLTLALGEHLAARPLSRTEVWCVVTGAEETGYPTGARRFVDAHLDELREAETLILDNIGAGDLRHLIEEGIILPVKMDPGLLELARSIGRRHPEWNVGDSVCNLGYTDATPVLLAGCRALALWAEGPDGFLVNYHWPTDTFENVDPATLERAGTFVLEMLQAIDRGEDGR